MSNSDIKPLEFPVGKFLERAADKTLDEDRSIYTPLDGPSKFDSPRPIQWPQASDASIPMDPQLQAVLNGSYHAFQERPEPGVNITLNCAKGTGGIESQHGTYDAILAQFTARGLTPSAGSIASGKDGADGATHFNLYFKDKPEDVRAAIDDIFGGAPDTAPIKRGFAHTPSDPVICGTIEPPVTPNYKPLGGENKPVERE